MSDQQSTPSSARPSKVTIAASLGGAACFVLIFTLFDTLGRLRGVEMRDDIDDQLASPPFDTLGVSTDQVLDLMRAVAFVDGALAAAGVVLAVFLIRRHQGARYGFTVVAALLLFTLPVSGVLAFLAAAAAVMLWSEESRAWFAGRPPRSTAREEAKDRSASPGGWPFGPGERHGASDGAPPTWPARPPESAGQAGPASPAAPAADTQPPPYSGTFGETSGSGGPPINVPVDQGSPPGEVPPSTPVEQPYGSPDAHSGAPGWLPQATSGPPAYGAPGRGRRPGSVTTAVVLTFVGSAIGLGVGLLLMVGLSVDSASIEEAIRSDSSFDSLGWEVQQVLAVLWVFAAMVVVWSIAGIVLGVFVLRRQMWARWLLVLSATMTALLSLLAILSLFSVVTLLLGAATVVLLLVPSASAWFAGGADTRGPRGPGGQPPYPPAAPPGPPEVQHPAQWSDRPGPW